jgi:NAD(P)-dependent dehydrogenase (short-subunit alcohol dehydrogenase family)
MATVLITGASRGLGLDFARQYAADGWRVLATCRTPARAMALRDLGAKVAIHALDVTDHDAVHGLARELAGEAIDVLIANAGIFIARDMTPQAVDAGAWLEMFAVNTIAPFVCAGAFLDHVARSGERKMIAVSSIVGSVGHVGQGGRYAYRSSKAALNSAWRTFAHDHPEVIAAMVSPGRVRTDMNPDAPNAPEASVASLRRVIAGLTQADSGGFFRVDGSKAPW